MPRVTNNNFIEEKNKLENQPLYLYTIYDFDGASNNKYYVNNKTDITFDLITYLSMNINHDRINQNTDGKVDTVKVTLSNISREIQALAETYDVRGKKVDIKLVFANELTDASCHVTESFYIDFYSANESNFIFSCSSKMDLMDINLPGRRFGRTYCSWKFKSLECGYSGTETKCSKTLDSCHGLGNRARFGGFPSIPLSRINL